MNKQPEQKMKTTGSSTVPVYIYDDDEALGAGLAAEILSQIQSANDTGKKFLLGCPGGRSVASTYRAMGRMAGEQNIDLSSTVIVMMDNYVFEKDGNYTNCPDDAHYSCVRFAKEDIQKCINSSLQESHAITDENVWFPNPASPAEYDKKITGAGGIDFFIIASGASDGHVAFNPPGSLRESLTRIVTIADTTRRDNLGTFPEFESIEDVPCFGVTVGIDTMISLSKQMALVISGSHKKNAVTELVKRDRYDPQWPVSLLFESSSASLFLDRSAAEGLQ